MMYELLVLSPHLSAPPSPYDVWSLEWVVLCHTPDESSSESAVEEETLGLSVPDEEEEGSVGDVLDDASPASRLVVLGSGSGQGSRWLNESPTIGHLVNSQKQWNIG